MFGLNRNVWLNILLAGVNGIADSVWSGTVFVAFLYKLTNNSNSKVAAHVLRIIPHPSAHSAPPCLYAPSLGSHWLP